MKIAGGSGGLKGDVERKGGFREASRFGDPGKCGSGDREFRQYIAKSVHEFQRGRGCACSGVVPERYDERWGDHVWRALPESLSNVPAVVRDIACGEVAQLTGGRGGEWRPEMDGGALVFRKRDEFGQVRRTLSMAELDMGWQAMKRYQAGVGHPVMTILSGAVSVLGGGEPLEEVDEEVVDKRKVLLPEWARHMVDAVVIRKSCDGVLAGVRVGTDEEFGVADANLRVLGVRLGDGVPGMGSRECRVRWKLEGQRLPGRVLAHMGDGRDRSRGWGDKVVWLLMQLVARVPRNKRGGEGILLTVRIEALQRMLWGESWRARNREELRELAHVLNNIWIQVGASRWRPVVCVEWGLDGCFARFRICPPQCGDHGALAELRLLEEAWWMGVRSRRWCLGNVFQSLMYEFDRQRADRKLGVKRAGGRPRGRAPVYSTVPEVERLNGEAGAREGRGRRARNPYLDQVRILNRRELARLYGGEGASDMGECAEFHKLVHRCRRAVRELGQAGLVDVEKAGRGGIRVTQAIGRGR